MTDLDLDALFKAAETAQTAELETDPFEGGHTTFSRCKCGALFTLSMPSYCMCGEAKCYWRTIEGEVLTLDKMKIGHLTSSIKMLAEKMDSLHGEIRTKYEIALDLLYKELGSREKETNQLVGIQAALFRSIT
jgi:hypothetical protein